MSKKKDNFTWSSIFQYGKAILLLLFFLICGTSYFVLKVYLPRCDRKKVALSFCKEYYSGNYETMRKSILPQYSKTMEDSLKNQLGLIKQVRSSQRSKITCEYEKQKKLSKDRFHDLQEEIKKEYSITIDGAYEVNLSITATLPTSSNSEEKEMILIQVGKNYYVWNNFL